MSIATKTGDAGETSLMYGRRVPKTDRRVDAYGTVDELNAALGLVRATTEERLVQEVVLSVQKELVLLMGELAVADQDRERYLKDGYEVLNEAAVDRLTDVVHDLEKNYHVNFKRWATPGHSLSSAALDLARTTCRRAERRVVGLAESSGYVNAESVRYLNRLSDILWLFARYIETKDTESQ
jgi:cob(I)alamin adenosyltransferase